jgi:hypothetical protein
MLKIMLKIQRFSIVLLALIVATAICFPVYPVKAAELTSVSDTLSTVVASTAANHTIQFTTPTGVAAGETITVIFPASFPDGLSGVDFADMDLNDGGEKTLAAACNAATWGAAVATRTITFTSCTDTIAGASTVTIEIGTHAAGPGDTQIVNPVAANDLGIDITSGSQDTGSLAVSIIADDSVAVSSVVNPTITFSISDITIGFGDLSTSTGRWATGDTNGGDAGASLPTAAHTMGIATNATNGWAITYNGATLTSGADTITATSGISGDSDGTQDSEEFGISASTDGDCTIASGYERAASANWDYVVSATTTLASENDKTATETISVSYLANISGTTEAGSYSTAITYIATATF